ncbi:MAG: homocysteine S-methyltransferase family protein [Lachnospiraceae bacterium]|nr:homocysteine S-methyltransferase family protein [Lachnospiraceae bacterium]
MEICSNQEQNRTHNPGQNPARRPLLERLGRERLYCDGGSGTILQSMGLAGGELPETWNLKHPDRIISLARGYFEAGCDIVNTNTFGANALKYPENLSEIVEAGVHLCMEGRRLAGREDAYVALDIGPTGRLLAPMGDLPFDRAVELFAEVVKSGAKAGADLILIETMSDSYEAKAAVLAAKENCDLPVLITLIFDERGKLLTGGTIESAVAMLEGLGVDAIGINCGLGPAQMRDYARRMMEAASIPVIVNPNAGLPRQEDGRTVYDVGPEEFAAEMAKIADLGVQVIGGCCGTTPEHIRREIATTHSKAVVLPAPETKQKTIVTSFSQAVEIGDRPVLIGERINPTGKKRFKQALRDHDIEYILQQGLAQEDAGAQILDVNVGLPEIDEPAMMEEVLRSLQSVSALPLQIDTTDPAALERGLRHYNGKAMVNSVNGKQESIETVMPLVKKYGGVLVALTLDEDGIPDTADGRVAIARRIYEAADRYDIPRKDIVIDCLAMTISSDPRSALVTLETIRRVHEELNGRTILGVSNISFGLPAREVVNAHFLTMALYAGLSCAILNPNNAVIMQAWRAFYALTALDENCADFIAAYADYQSGAAGSAAGASGASGTAGASGSAGAKSGAPSQVLSLQESVERGVSGRAAEAVREALAERDGLTIINEELIPALDRVGKGFEAGRVFLPQLLMSAEAAKAAFEVIKNSMKGGESTSKGRVILATVQGDIHDIGKNIVKVMLENYSFEVIDLGKDVPPEVIVETALREQIPVVGLSALMTTTVVSMEKTIKLLREKKPDTKVIVGGAVMTQEYADAIGADFYAKDAMDTVRFVSDFYERSDI